MARTFRHWTPRYVVNRLALAAYERRCPAAPWITRDACRLLDEWLQPQHVGVEWGSGRSTLWLAERVGRLTSIEHDAAWHRQVAHELKVRGTTNAEYYLAAGEASSDGALPRYVELGAGPAESIDFALVDGMHRDLCTQVAIERLRPGGRLILDNAERYIRHASYSPAAIERTGLEPSPLWIDLARRLAQWQCVWTSNGVCDTALFTKP